MRIFFGISILLCLVLCLTNAKIYPMKCCECGELTRRTNLIEFSTNNTKELHLSCAIELYNLDQMQEGSP